MKKKWIPGTLFDLKKKRKREYAGQVKLTGNYILVDI